MTTRATEGQRSAAPSEGVLREGGERADAAHYETDQTPTDLAPGVAAGSQSRQMTMAEASTEVWIVYMLRCADGSLYTGITTDVNRRCEQHNAGTASRYTRSRRPAGMVYQEAHASRSLALKREAAIKAMSRRQKELMMIRLAG